MCLAVGSNSSTSNIAAYSYDGINWNILGFFVINSVCFSIGYNGTIFVAGGQGIKTLAYSYNGINWTVVPSSSSILDTICYNIAWIGNRFIAIGGSSSNSKLDEKPELFADWSNNTSGIILNGNGISLYGSTLLSNTHIIPKTLLSINDYRCLISSKVLN
jgi:hypothetical protein